MTALAPATFSIIASGSRTSRPDVARGTDEESVTDPCASAPSRSISKAAVEHGHAIVAECAKGPPHAGALRILSIVDDDSARSRCRGADHLQTPRVSEACGNDVV